MWKLHQECEEKKKITQRKEGYMKEEIVLAHKTQFANFSSLPFLPHGKLASAEQ